VALACRCRTSGWTGLADPTSAQSWSSLTFTSFAEVRDCLPVSRIRNGQVMATYEKPHRVWLYGVVPLPNPNAVRGATRNTRASPRRMLSPRPNQVPSGAVKCVPYFDSNVSATLRSSATGNSPSTPSSKQNVAVSSTPASSLSRQPPHTRGGCGKARRTNCRARSRSSRPGRARWQRRQHSKISDACMRQRAPPLTQFAHSIAPWRSTRRSAPAGMRRECRSTGTCFPAWRAGRGCPRRA
jgi:hypothetical protein